MTKESKAHEIASKEWSEIVGLFYSLERPFFKPWRDQTIEAGTEQRSVCLSCTESNPGCCTIPVLCSTPEVIEIILKHPDKIKANWKTIQGKALVEFDAVKIAVEKGFDHYNECVLPEHVPSRDTWIDRVGYALSQEINGTLFERDRTGCAFLKDGKCTVYDSRPIACASYFLAPVEGFTSASCEVSNCETLVPTLNLKDGNVKIRMEYFNISQAINLPYFTGGIMKVPDIVDGKRADMNEMPVPYTMNAAIVTVLAILVDMYAGVVMDPIQGLVDYVKEYSND